MIMLIIYNWSIKLNFYYKSDTILYYIYRKMELKPQGVCTQIYFILLYFILFGKQRNIHTFDIFIQIHT